MQKCLNFLDPFKIKEQTLKEKEKYLLFSPDIDEKKRKELLLDNPNLEFYLISKLAETYKLEDEEKKGKKLIDYYMYRNLYETPLIVPNIMNYGKQEKLKYSFNNNTEILKKEYMNKIYDFFANIFKSKNNEKEINNNIIPMNKEEPKKTVEENTIKEQSLKSIKKEGTGKCFEMLVYLFGLILFLFILKNYYDGT